MYSNLKTQQIAKLYFILSLSLVVLIVFNVFVLQYISYKKKSDNQALNIAKNQIILSHHIKGLLYEVREDTSKVGELNKNILKWNLGHKALLNLCPSKYLITELKKVEVFINVINNQNKLSNKSITQNQDLFSRAMQSISKKMEDTFNFKWYNSIWIEALFYISFIVILVLEYYLIMKPFFKRVTTQGQRLKKIAWLHSHEIRRPSANILGLLEMIDESNFEENNSVLFKFFEQEIQALDQVIHQVVAYTNERKNIDI